MTATLTRPTTDYDTVTSLDELRTLVGQPSERSVLKERPALDAHTLRFIARSPFLFLGTSDRDGRCDVSPKGDAPGFVLVLDDRTLVIPDRPGNRRVDSLANIVENPHVGLLFVIPGIDETLRVNGTATVVKDAALLERMSVDGKRPLLGILVKIEQAYLHCARSFLRAKLWDPERFMPRDEMPTLAQMIHDQIRPPGRTDEEHARIVAETRQQQLKSYCELY